VDQYKRILLLRLILAILGIILALESFFLRMSMGAIFPSTIFSVSTYSGNNNSDYYDDQDYSSSPSWSNDSSDSGDGWDSGSGDSGWDSGGDSGSWDSGGDGGDSGSW
jgi:hypothetical protein